MLSFLISALALLTFFLGLAALALEIFFVIDNVDILFVIDSVFLRVVLKPSFPYFLSSSEEVGEFNFRGASSPKSSITLRSGLLKIELIKQGLCNSSEQASKLSVAGKISTVEPSVS